MKFILLHDMVGSDILVPINRIVFVEEDYYGNERVSEVYIATHNDTTKLFAKESVNEIFRLIRRATEN